MATGATVPRYNRGTADAWLNKECWSHDSDMQPLRRGPLALSGHIYRPDLECQTPSLASIRLEGDDVPHRTLHWSSWEKAPKVLVIRGLMKKNTPGFGAGCCRYDKPNALHTWWCWGTRIPEVAYGVCVILYHRNTWRRNINYTGGSDGRRMIKLLVHPKMSKSRFY